MPKLQVLAALATPKNHRQHRGGVLLGTLPAGWVSPEGCVGDVPKEAKTQRRQSNK